MVSEENFSKIMLRVTLHNLYCSDSARWHEYLDYSNAATLDKNLMKFNKNLMKDQFSKYLPDYKYPQIFW